MYRCAVSCLNWQLLVVSMSFPHQSHWCCTKETKSYQKRLKLRARSVVGHILSLYKSILIHSPATGGVHGPTAGNGWRKGSWESWGLIGSKWKGVKSGWRTKLSSLSSGPGYTSNHRRHVRTHKHTRVRKHTTQDKTQVRNNRNKGTEYPNLTRVWQSCISMTKQISCTNMNIINMNCKMMTKKFKMSATSHSRHMQNKVKLSFGIELHSNRNNYSMSKYDF